MPAVGRSDDDVQGRPVTPTRSGAAGSITLWRYPEIPHPRSPP